MLVTKLMVKNTVWFSLFVQIITGLVSLHGLDLYILHGHCFDILSLLFVSKLDSLHTVG